MTARAAAGAHITQTIGSGSAGARPLAARGDELGGAVGLPLEGICRLHVALGREEPRRETFCGVPGTLTIAQKAIYWNLRRIEDVLADQLPRRDVAVSTVQSGLDQESRGHALREHRSESSRVLTSKGLFAFAAVP